MTAMHLNAPMRVLTHRNDIVIKGSLRQEPRQQNKSPVHKNVFACFNKIIYQDVL